MAIIDYTILYYIDGKASGHEHVWGRFAAVDVLFVQEVVTHFIQYVTA